MQILAVNCGSSSVKSALVDTVTGWRAFEARIEEIGTASCRLRVADAELPLGAVTTLDAAVRRTGAELRAAYPASSGPEAVAHRIVHGGSRFVAPALLDDQTIEAIDAISALAPLHNPPALAAIRILRRALPDIPHVAIFDTAFHATLPACAREYALPRDLAQKLDLRRFGFHGTSHGYVMHTVAAYLAVKPQDLRIISCHLGNGASVAAIEYGRSIDTSMGMTPMEGLVMGTRAGDLDPGVMLRLQREFDVADLDELLNTRCGLKGLTGTSDMRDVQRRAAQGEESCRLAVALYAHRVRKYIGAYAAVMGGVDVIAFTGGVGENSPMIRQQCTQRLEFLGTVLDEDANHDATFGAKTSVAEISDTGARARLLVVRADEELAMAREAAARLAVAMQLDTDEAKLTSRVGHR